ncbi:MAG: POTRA domain-containing protein [Vicinamibacterales bacterium]
MNPAVVVVCLLVAAPAAAAEPLRSDRENERPPAAPEYRLREVRFAGDPAFKADALKKVLEELKGRRLIPGIWTRRPPYDAPAVEADLARLRSFYLSNGYFDARVEIGDVTFDGRDATVTLHVQAGPQSRVRQLKIAGPFKEDRKIVGGLNGEFPVDRLCECLFDAKRAAEAQGRIDFAAELEVSQANEAARTGKASSWLDITASVRTGSPYIVGRINFSGHYRINESTLRRAMVLQERGLFDVGQLRRSLARLNRSGLFEPIAPDDVVIEKSPSDLTADLTISLHERPRGQWWLSGPVAATGFTGSLQGAISSRLPAWGRGVLETSTYYVTFSLIGLPNPLARLLPFAAKTRLSPSLLLERPYLPGQVFSGFALSPKRPVRTLLSSYGVTHLGRGARAVLESDPSVPTTLLVPVQSSHASVDGERSRVGFLICEPRQARLRWLRRGAAYAADLALGAFRPF